MVELFTELWAFLRARKKYWLLPIVIVLLMVGALILFTGSSALSPFVYILF